MYRNFSAVIDRTFFVVRYARAEPGRTDDSVELAHVLARDRASTGMRRAPTDDEHPADSWWGLPSL